MKYADIRLAAAIALAAVAFGGVPAALVSPLATGYDAYAVVVALALALGVALAAVVATAGGGAAVRTVTSRRCEGTGGAGRETCGHLECMVALDHLN